MTSLDLDHAIEHLARAVLAAGDLDRDAARRHVREAADRVGLLLDVDAEGPGVGAFRSVQEYALVAAKALCTVRAPPALRPDHGADAYRRAGEAIRAAHECVCGRRSA